MSDGQVLEHLSFLDPLPSAVLVIYQADEIIAGHGMDGKTANLFMASLTEESSNKFSKWPITRCLNIFMQIAGE